MIAVDVVGNLVLDLLAWPVESIRWDGTVWVEKFTRSLGGNGANTSYTLAKMGCTVKLHGAVGADAEGGELVRLLEEAGVDTTAIERLTQPTPTTMGLVKRGGARAFVHRPGASREALREPVGSFEGRHLHVANPFGVIALRKLAVENLARAKQQGLSTSLDCGWDSKGEWGAVVLPCLPHVDVLFLNAEEGRLITGTNGEKNVLAALHGAGARMVLLKQGARGVLVSGDGYRARVPGFPVEAVDSTGAGDVFAGAFLAAWLRGMAASEAARFANAAAAMSVMELGSVAGVRDFTRTLAWMREAPPSSAPPA
jgi:sugar/nucleoside kinase (ribokinase family)